MEEVMASPNSRRQEFLEELKAEIEDPNHKRLLEAYEGDDPVSSMEAELVKILLEVLNRES